MKFEKILLPFDGSTYSVDAAKYTLNLAKLYGAHVTIVHCYEWTGTLPEVPASLMEDIKTNRINESETILKRAQGIFENQGVEFTVESIAGPAGQVLANLSKSKEYDLIVMGSHGHSDIAGLFLGSVTHKVLNTIYCPVLIVP